MFDTYVLFFLSVANDFSAIHNFVSSNTQTVELGFEYKHKVASGQQTYHKSQVLLVLHKQSTCGWCCPKASPGPSI